MISSATKKEQRRLRREQRKKAGLGSRRTIVVEKTDAEDQQFWLGLRARAAAMKVINDMRQRPYWLSTSKDSGTPRPSGYFPCVMLSRDGRWYYGFLFREHRDKCFKNWRVELDARKELTGGKDLPL